MRKIGSALIFLMSLASCGTYIPPTKAVFKNDFNFWPEGEVLQFVSSGGYHLEYDGSYSYSLRFRDGSSESDYGTYEFFFSGFTFTNSRGAKRTLMMCDLAGQPSYYEFEDIRQFAKEGEEPKEYKVIFHAVKIFD